MELSQDESWQPIPQLATYCVVYNCGAESSLTDPAIREALTLAVDRNALAELAGVTALAAEGFIPPGVPESEEADFRTTGGALLDNDPDHVADYQGPGGRGPSATRATREAAWESWSISMWRTGTPARWPRSCAASGARCCTWT